MRRLLTLVLSTLAVTLVSAVLLAGPALATEGEGGEEAAEAATGFGSGDWDGLILAAIAGVVVGILVYADADPSEIGGSGHH